MAGFELGSQQIATAQATCDTTSGGTQLVAARNTRREVVFRNGGAIDAYVGPSGLTTSTGLLVRAEETLTLATTAAVFGITASGTATFHVLEVFE